MGESYRQHFSTPLEAGRYDETEYAPGSYSQLLWELEQSVLASWVGEFRHSHPHIDYLDFASGTGRVAAYMEPLVEMSRSIEISESMADRARERLKRTEVICQDITIDEAAANERYDLITAFRFFLNAEPALRVAALRALRSRMRDEKSWLIFNNHGNLWSTKLLAWPVHRLRRLGKGWQPRGNYLRHVEVERLLASAGLRVVRRIGLGVLGGSLCQRLPENLARRWEGKCAGSPLLGKFGQDVLYIAALRR